MRGGVARSRGEGRLVFLSLFCSWKGREEGIPHQIQVNINYKCEPRHHMCKTSWQTMAYFPRLNTLSYLRAGLTVGPQIVFT